MKRLRLLALVGLALLTGASSSVAAPRVIGGTTIRIQSAPWAVFIRQTIPGGALLCSGSIVDPLHVLTAAHCLYDRSGSQASITALTVRAGISNYATPQAGDVEQIRQVSSFRIHQGYVQPAGVTPDDVAVISLSDPLDLSGPAAAAVSLPAAGAPYPTGADVGVAGFGRESSASQPDGSLNWLASKVDVQGGCGGRTNAVIPDADAVAFCAITPSGTSCTGDSGAGLVTTTGARTLIGIVSAGPTGCTAGSGTILTYVPAPEILRFIQGDDQPPVAPRSNEDTFVNILWSSTPRVGNALTCESGNWDDAPTLAYAFVDLLSGEVLQQGPKRTYVFASANVGATILCRVLATNEGGTAVLSTGPTPPIKAAPPIGIAPLRPVAALRGHTVTVRVVLYTPSGLSGKFAVCITPSSQVGSRICASEVVDDGSFGAFPFKLQLKIKAAAPLGSSRMTVTALAGVSSSTKTALVRVSRG